MTIENWQRVKELLDQAIEMAPEQRATFLDEACGSDAGLRAELESLLSAGDGLSADFLQSPLPGEFDREMQGIDSAGTLAAGQIFADRFKLIRRLGEGSVGGPPGGPEFDRLRSQALVVLRWLARSSTA